MMIGMPIATTPNPQKDQTMSTHTPQFMYNVMVEGKANAVFDTADESLRFAMHHVYITPNRLEQARTTLERGEPFRYGYGFSSVDILPIKKRTITALAKAEGKG